MKEFSQRHFQQAADAMMKGIAGQTCTFNWRASHTGTWDDGRQEYVGGTEIRASMEQVACMVYNVSGNDILYGDWGGAQVGDLIMAFDPSLDIDNFDDLKIAYRQKEYRLEPASDVPMDSLAGIIGDAQLFRVLHFRYIGEQQGVV